MGLGSFLHIIVSALTFAIEDGCVLIATSGSTLSRYNGSDSSPFKTLTNCKEEDAKDIKYLDFGGVSDFDENGMRARYMFDMQQFVILDSKSASHYGKRRIVISYAYDGEFCEYNQKQNEIG